MPQAIVPVLLVSAAASIGSSVYTGIQAEKASARQAKTTEAIGEYNAKVHRNRAVGVQQQAEFERQRIRAKNRRLLAKQENQLAKSGSSLLGSALDLQNDSALEAELEALSVTYQANLSSNESLANANLTKLQASSQASGLRSQGRTALIQGVSQGIATFGQTASSIAAQPSMTA